MYCVGSFGKVHIFDRETKQSKYDAITFIYTAMYVTLIDD